MKSAREILEDACELLNRPGVFVQGSFFSPGKNKGPNAPDRFCAMGAIGKVTGAFEKEVNYERGVTQMNNENRKAVYALADAIDPGWRKSPYLKNGEDLDAYATSTVVGWNDRHRSVKLGGKTNWIKQKFDKAIKLLEDK